MKKTKIIAIVFITGFVLVSANSMGQSKKQADGTIVYADGTKKLPNGTVIYQGTRTIKKANTNVTLPDGSVIYRDGSRKYPAKRIHNTSYPKRSGYRTKRSYHHQWLPPGQAKKIYGGSAKDYAPGQQKKWKRDNESGKNENHEHGSHGKGHKD